MILTNCFAELTIFFFNQEIYTGGEFSKEKNGEKNKPTQETYK